MKPNRYAAGRLSGWPVVLLMLWTSVAPAQAQQVPDYIERPDDAAGVFAIYPGDGVPPGSEDWTWHERAVRSDRIPFAGPSGLVHNVVIPTLTMFRPAPGTANGTAVIIAPGGAFYFLTMDKEGYDVARLLTKWGITAFVLRYRLARTPESDKGFLAHLENWMRTAPRQPRGAETSPQRDPVQEAASRLAEEDGRQAIRFVRQRAAEWGIDPRKIGIIGFSAGGHVAVATALEHDAESRPDFVAAIYPGYRMAPVPSDAPPLFLATADDDILVGPISVARLYEAWHRAGRPVELHIFAAGNHGFGTLRQNLPPDAWPELFRNWLRYLNFLPATGTGATPEPSTRNQTGQAMAPQIEIRRSGTHPTSTGAPEYFTGTVQVEYLQQAPAPARVSIGRVTFEPGARTAWHTHPLGQTLIVTEGVGRVQAWGGPIQEIRPGDVVWIPPGVKHWHGAAPDTRMTHLAIQEALDGKAVEWMEHVTDAQYRGEQ